MNRLSYSQANVNTSPHVPYEVPSENIVPLLQLRIEQLEQENDTLKQTLHTLKQARDWERGLHAVPASVASPSHKATIRTVMHFYNDNQALADEQGYIQLKPWVVEKMAGQSDQTIRDNIAYCSKEYGLARGQEVIVNEGAIPLFDKKLVKVPDARKPKGFRFETYIRPRDLVYHPQEYGQSCIVRKQGGSIGKCECGGELIIKKRTLTEQEIVTCSQCDRKDVSHPYQVNRPLSATRLQSQLDFVEEVDESPSFEPQEVNLTLVCPQDTNSQDDFAMEEEEEIRPSALEELQTAAQWVCWKYQKDKKGKPTKVPYNANPSANNAKAETNNASTWATYEQAQQTYTASQSWKIPYDGVGFVFNRDYTGIDLDHCIEDGKLTDRAQEILDFLCTYSEISPSGTGIHLIAKATIPAGVKRKGVEMYDRGRFFTFTGNHLPGTPATIEDRQEELAVLYADIVPHMEKRAVSTRSTTSLDLSDNAVLDLAMTARNSAKFKRLWRGDTGNYPSASEADLALCNMIAFYAGNDTDRIDRLFRRSRLYRGKWDEKRGQQTYGEMTIRKSLDALEEQVAS